MNVLLIDNNPHLQKTLQYFLHPYAPSIYSIGSQDELPEKIDIVFLDSEHKDNEYISHLKSKEEKPPIVLISRDEKTLTELAPEYPASLKKPIQYNQLQEIIHHLIPETRSFKASSYLKFYDSPVEQQEQPITLNKSEPNTEEPKVTPEEETPENIPLMSDENAEKKQTSEQKQETPPDSSTAFDKKQSIVIPDDITLVDKADSTSLHNTNTFLKKVTENIKKEESTGSQVLQSPKNDDSLETPATEEPTGSQILQSPPQNDSFETSTKKEEPTKPQASKPHQEKSDDLEDLSTVSDIQDIEKSQPFSTSAHFDNIEKWDTLSDKIVEIIDKHFQNKWEMFINTQLKEDIKEMIHKEVSLVFKEQMKDILTTEGIQSIKKASEEISWKVIPELSKQIIQKEIKKLLDKPSTK